MNNTASANLQDFAHYQTILMPLIAEMGRNVDWDELVAEILLDADDSPQSQLDLTLGVIERFRGLIDFLVAGLDTIESER